MTDYNINVHPAIAKFAAYCRTQGIDTLDLAQQYAVDNPLSYGDYLMSGGFGCLSIIEQAEMWGWDISEQPDTILQIAREVFNNDSELGITYETIDSRIGEVFESSPPEIQALAEGGKLKDRPEVYLCTEE